jgi:hypothetical protein
MDSKGYSRKGSDAALPLSDSISISGWLEAGPETQTLRSINTWNSSIAQAHPPGCRRGIWCLSNAKLPLNKRFNSKEWNSDPEQTHLTDERVCIATTSLC